MTQKTVVSKYKFFASLSQIILVLALASPANAELSPDVGISAEYGEKTPVAQTVTAPKKKETAKVQAKKKTVRVAVKKVSPKKSVTVPKKAKEPMVSAASTLVAPNLLGVNSSVAVRNLPEGLTPRIVAEALSVRQGKTAALSVKTLPGANCDIDVFVVQRKPISAPGLETKIADGSGVCSWKWVVRSGTPRGSWGVKIVASKDGTSDDTWTTLNVGNVH